MIFDQALFIASVVGAAGLVCTIWLLRQPTKTRIAVGAAYLALYTYALWRAEIIPLQPPRTAIQGNPRIVSQVLEIFWWFSLARLLVTAGRAFLLIDHRAEERKFATELLAGVVYISVFFSVAGLVFDLPITGLIATSGVIAIVLGLALQSTLSDLFSGIALNIEGPIHVGDWIALEGNVEGQVIEINWRATHLMTATRESVVVPNSNIAKSRIVNFSSPSQTQGVEFAVSLDNRTSPSRGIEVIEQAVLNCRSVLLEPGPKVRTKGFAASSVEYQVRFFVESVAVAGQAKSDVLNSIYRHANWAGISIAAPQAGDEPVLRIGAVDEKPVVPKVAERVPLSAYLLPPERAALQAALKKRVMQAGEMLVKQGAEAQSVFLIETGVVSLMREREDGTSVEVERRGPGDDFGAPAVLSGKPMSVSVRALTSGIIYELPKSDITRILEARPELRAELERALAERLLLSGDAGDAKRPKSDAEIGVAARLMERIGSFFAQKGGD
jgi:small-conductance mechanosensitive channel/CRP-like cAMP-binding protein